MITREQKFRLGIFLVITVVLFIVILAVFVVPKLKHEGDFYYINFKGFSVNGVNEGADVKYQGVKIGKVVRLEVNPTDLNSILVHVQIKKGFPLKEDMRASLQYLGITGLRFIEISGGKAESPFIPPYGEILTKKGLGEKAEDIVLSFDSVVSALNDILRAENRKKISDIFTNIEKTSRSTSNILSSREKSIMDSITKFNTAMTQLAQLSENLTSFSAYLTELKSKGYVEKIARDADKLIKTVNQRFSQEELGKAIASVDKLMSNTEVSIKKIEVEFVDLSVELKTTVAGLREAMENLVRLTRELREDPTLLIRSRPTERNKK